MFTFILRGGSGLEAVGGDEWLRMALWQHEALRLRA